MPLAKKITKKEIEIQTPFFHVNLTTTSNEKGNSIYQILAYISPKVILFWWSTDLCEDGEFWFPLRLLILAPLLLMLWFFNIPFGVASNDLFSCDCILMVTRFETGLLLVLQLLNKDASNVDRSLVDFAKCLLRRLLFTDILTEPLLFAFIWGWLRRFS